MGFRRDDPDGKSEKSLTGIHQNKVNGGEIKTEIMNKQWKTGNVVASEYY